MTENKSKIITIIGAGVWGTALASLINKERHEVRLWSRRSFKTLAVAIENANIILSAVSIIGVRPIIEQLQMLNWSKKTILITATKGLDPLTTLTPSQIWQTSFCDRPIVVLSGPNLSKEIQQKLPAATVAASHNLAAAETVQAIFTSENFRVYVNNDPLGTELGGTLKNVMAIAAGVCDGLQLGTNAKAGLISRALPEMVRIGTYLGAKPATFFGLSGLGDLMATCNSPLSRNYQVGYRLAQGQTLEQILSELEGTVEGINTTEVVMKIASKNGLYVPICDRVYQLLQEKITPQEAVQSLMERELRSEFHDLEI
jgi:glycerol-3-phosphate dehydrogenase (NAD(P)+)